VHRDAGHGGRRRRHGAEPGRSGRDERNFD
jgi:hypothetical protein